MIYIMIILSVVAAVVAFFLKRRGYYLYFKLQRDISIGDECLEFEMQFPTGEKIYRIKTEYVMMIASERMRVIDDYLNYIAWLGVEKETIDTGLANMVKLTDEIVLKPYEVESLESRDKHHAIANSLRDRTPKAFNANRENIEKMYLMFFILDGEDWRTITPKIDKKKLDLLHANPHLQSFFFQRLSAIIEPLGLTYQNAILIATETLMLRQKVHLIIEELSNPQE